MVPGLSLLDCLQLQKLKVFALPPLSQGLSFLSPAHQPPPKIAPCWNTLCECEDEARGFGVSWEREAAVQSTCSLLHESGCSDTLSVIGNSLCFRI